MCGIVVPRAKPRSRQAKSPSHRFRCNMLGVLIPAPFRKTFIDSSTSVMPQGNIVRNSYALSLSHSLHRVCVKHSMSTPGASVRARDEMREASERVIGKMCRLTIGKLQFFEVTVLEDSQDHEHILTNGISCYNLRECDLFFFFFNRTLNRV